MENKKNGKLIITLTDDSQFEYMEVSYNTGAIEIRQIINQIMLNGILIDKDSMHKIHHIKQFNMFAILIYFPSTQIKNITITY